MGNDGTSDPGGCSTPVPPEGMLSHLLEDAAQGDSCTDPLQVVYFSVEVMDLDPAGSLASFGD